MDAHKLNMLPAEGGNTCSENKRNLKKVGVQSYQSIEKKAQGTKKAHSCKGDKAIVFYDPPKIAAHGARKEQVNIRRDRVDGNTFLSPTSSSSSSPA